MNFKFLEKFLEKLGARERLYVLGLFSFIILLSISAGLSSFYTYRNNLAEQLKNGYAIINQLRKLKVIISDLAPTQDLPAQTQVFSQVNSFLQQYQINPISINEEKKVDKNDKSYQISIRLQSVPMSNLLSFFYEVEFGGKLPLSITTISIRKAISSQDLYDVNMTIALTGG